MKIPRSFRPLTVNKVKLILILIVFSCYGYTLGNPTETKDTHENRTDAAAVTLDGEILFYVRGSVSITAGSRADAISERIRDVARSHRIPLDSLHISPFEEEKRIMAGRVVLMLVTPADAEWEKVSQTNLSKYFEKQIRSGIETYRYERSGPVLLRHSLYALAALALVIVTLFVLFRILRRMTVIIENKMRARLERMEDKSFHLIRSEQLRKAIQILLRAVKIILVILILVSFLQYILGLFPFSRGFASYTLSLIMNPLNSIATSILNFLPSLAFLIIIYFITRYILRLTKLFFSGIRQGAIHLRSFDDDWAMPTYKILRVIVVVFAVVIAYPYIPGSETSAFKGISVFLGVLFSLGSSSFISNLIAGYSMTYRGSFKTGDLIEVDDQLGYVEEQKLMVTRLRSRKNEEITIPNSQMLNSNIINYSKRSKDLGLILHTTVGIGYETPWRLVDSMLKEAAIRTEGLLQEPPPFVWKKSLDDFAVTYEINAYCNDAAMMGALYDRLHQNILDVFNENNVQIMTPAYEGDPVSPKVVPPDQWSPALTKKDS